MTLKEIKQEFTVLKLDDKYHLYSKKYNEKYGKRSTQQYLATLIKQSKTCFSVDGMDNSKTGSITKLKEYINHNINNHKHPISYYDPTLREGCIKFYVIDDYLTSLGFKRDSYSNRDTYVLISDYSLCESHKISITIPDFIHGDSQKYITIYKRDYSYVSIDIEDLDLDGILIILNNLINSIVIEKFTKDFKLIQQIDSSSTNFNEITLKTFNISTFESIKESFDTEDLKMRLQEIIDSL